MKLFDMQKTMLVTDGDYGATLSKVELRDSKSKPGAKNISLTWDVVLDSGRVVKVFDLLPALTEKIAWRYGMLIKALDLNIDATADITTESFFNDLKQAVKANTPCIVRVGMEHQQPYPPRNKVVAVRTLNDGVVSMVKADRHDSDTDAPAQPSRNSAVGEQAPMSEDPQIVTVDDGDTI